MQIKRIFKLTMLLIFSTAFIFSVKADNGYKLWLEYLPITDAAKLAVYKKDVGTVYFATNSPQRTAAYNELLRGCKSMLGVDLRRSNSPADADIIVGTLKESEVLRKNVDKDQFEKIGKEGYILKSRTIGVKQHTFIAANSDIGLLYGVFNFLRLMQVGADMRKIDTLDFPKIHFRMLNHWDNLNGSIERGYAGNSIWNWDKLPDANQRYIDYARVNASVGINGTVLNNVNADAKILTSAYILKIKALADIFRTYGIQVYLSVRFSSPIEIGGLKTADPLDPEVRKWWANKVDEIYKVIPDFGGFLVKANSEGQPGPKTYGRSHLDGANLFGDILAPHHGLVVWRAFVYNNSDEEDRAKQSYNEFKKFDGKFRPNVILQVKNGVSDFQPREPFHPLFGAMPNTSLMLELQLTQEYLGYSTHLGYEAPLFKETLESDTYFKGKGSTVSNIIQGKYNTKLLSGIAGVANVGLDSNWCGHPFAQANWYAFGRLAWNPEIKSAQIAQEWCKMTFSPDVKFVYPMTKIMEESRENTVNYMTPLGLYFLTSSSHYGPAPWLRHDFHRADSAGLGFERSKLGTNATSQYLPQVRDAFNDKKTIPEKYLLWFHHVNWDEKMKSDKTLWEELVRHYYRGVDSVRTMGAEWEKMRLFVDPERFDKVKLLMGIQLDEAIWWRNSCVLYFQSYSHLPIPDGLEKPAHDLNYYKSYKGLSSKGLADKVSN